MVVDEFIALQMSCCSVCDLHWVERSEALPGLTLVGGASVPPLCSLLSGVSGSVFCICSSPADEFACMQRQHECMMDLPRCPVLSVLSVESLVVSGFPYVPHSGENDHHLFVIGMLVDKLAKRFLYTILLIG